MSQTLYRPPSLPNPQRPKNIRSRCLTVIEESEKLELTGIVIRRPRFRSSRTSTPQPLWRLCPDQVDLRPQLDSATCHLDLLSLLVLRFCFSCFCRLLFHDVLFWRVRAQYQRASELLQR